MAKAQTWKHPKLGTFTFDGTDWETEIALPAFDAFTFADDSDRHGTYKLMFEAEDDSMLPTPGAVAVAEKVIANHKALVKRIAAAFWDDFNGRGPDSGMYWHDDLDSVADGLDMEDLPMPERAEDLLKLLGLPDVRIKQEVDGILGPVAEINFAAAFEDEHGVGVLTDGESVLGLGYSLDVSPFGEEENDEDEDEDGEDEDDDGEYDDDDDDEPGEENDRDADEDDDEK